MRAPSEEVEEKKRHYHFPSEREKAEQLSPEGEKMERYCFVCGKPGHIRPNCRRKGDMHIL